jgi:hypothetical protein
MEAFKCEDPAIAVGLQRLADGIDSVRVDVLGVKEEVRLLKEHQILQNGTVNDLRLAAATLSGAEIEKRRWEERAAGNTKWLLTAGMAGASVLSGIVFGILTIVSK